MNTQLQLSIELAPAYLLSLSIAYTDVNRRRCGGWKDNIQKRVWILGFGFWVLATEQATATCYYWLSWHLSLLYLKKPLP